jgi:hypothetical protein
MEFYHWECRFTFTYIDSHHIFISTFAKSGDAAFFVDSESICRFLGSSLFGKDRVPLKGAVQQKMRG